MLDAEMLFSLVHILCKLIYISQNSAIITIFTQDKFAREFVVYSGCVRSTCQETRNIGSWQAQFTLTRWSYVLSINMSAYVRFEVLTAASI
jgi:hypothetical protein